MKLEDINKVGVVGAGAMGFGIAINFALWGYPATLCDLSDTILQRAMKNIKDGLALFVREGLTTKQLADDTVRRITTTTDLAQIAANSDFITEAITERAEDKRELFNRLDGLCPPHTIFASNTSFLTLSEFALDIKRQDKIVITHYFLPPHIVPGVEVSRGPETSDEAFNTTVDLMKKIGKVPIKILKERPGCLLNRIQLAIRREAYCLWADGVATADDIETGIRATIGFRMPHEGPMMHNDLSGIWRWPEDVRAALAERLLDGISTPSAQAAEKIKQRMIKGKPWFVDQDKLPEVNKKRDIEYIQCLKKWYWSKGKYSRLTET